MLKALKLIKSLGTMKSVNKHYYMRINIKTLWLLRSLVS